ncbi:hypothetical protein LJC33_06830 [Eubacteriales bacterium OttesenSCG-928-N13]|nr:hypothetical protein [Eubacteriales bacterium OttesenSCG-928-N13]
MLIIHSAVPGMVYINGRFAGEADEEGAVSLPVSARGTLYIELRPLVPGFLPLARRIALSGGAVVPASVEGMRGMSLVQWPGGVLEAELSPEQTSSNRDRITSREQDALTMRLVQGDQTQLELIRGEERASHPLPNDALPPELVYLPDGGLQLMGRTQQDDAYLLALGDSLADARLMVQGRQVERAEDGSVRALMDMQDSVGHARLMQWTRAGDHYLPSDPEMMWANGSPNWPTTPEETALAALEATLLGLADEVNGYFVPGAISSADAALADAAQSDGCVPLKYALPGGQNAVGLVRLLTDNCAQVSAIAYQAQPMGGSQGMWRLSQMQPIA